MFVQPSVVTVVANLTLPIVYSLHYAVSLSGLVRPRLYPVRLPPNQLGTDVLEQVASKLAFLVTYLR